MSTSCLDPVLHRFIWLRWAGPKENSLVCGMGRREFLIYKRANPSFRNWWHLSPDSVFLSNAFRVRRWVSWFLPPTTTSARCGLAAPRTTTLLASASSDSRRSCLKKCWNFRLKKLQVREEAGSRVNFAATLRKWKYGLSNRFFLQMWISWMVGTTVERGKYCLWENNQAQK